jgi:hypothetical protein
MAEQRAAAGRPNSSGGRAWLIWAQVLGLAWFATAYLVDLFFPIMLTHAAGSVPNSATGAGCPVAYFGKSHLFVYYVHPGFCAISWLLMLPWTAAFLLFPVGLLALLAQKLGLRPKPPPPAPVDWPRSGPVLATVAVGWIVALLIVIAAIPVLARYGYFKAL